MYGKPTLPVFALLSPRLLSLCFWGTFPCLFADFSSLFLFLYYYIYIYISFSTHYYYYLIPLYDTSYVALATTTNKFKVLVSPSLSLSKYTLATVLFIIFYFLYIIILLFFNYFPWFILKPCLAFTIFICIYVHDTCLLFFRRTNRTPLSMPKKDIFCVKPFLAFPLY